MKITFGTSGWRAIISDEFTFENVRIASQAIATYIKEKNEESRGLIVGYDTRFLSEKFAETAAEVLATNGIRVWLTSRDTPTPALASEIRFRKVAGGINLTASHNPPEYNGIKFSPESGGPAPPEITGRIEEIANQLLQSKTPINSIPFNESLKKKLIEYLDIRPRYLQELRTKINFQTIHDAKLKIVVDVLYGTGRDYLDTLLKEAGVELEVLHNWRDPYFGNSAPEPSEEHLGVLIQKVKESKANLGLATDGDADRFGIIDSDGTYITPNQVICLLFLHLIESRGWKGSVVRTVATTHLIDAIAQKHGIPVHETPVGFKYIGEWMEKEKVIIGGEESGGLSILGHVPEKDGIIACLLIAEMVAQREETIRETLAHIAKTYGTYYTDRVDLRLTPEKKEKIWHELNHHVHNSFAGIKVLETKFIDGVGWKLEDGSFILIRPSGTEPLLRCYAETTSPDTLQKLITALKALAHE
jgi:phosphoglucomutase